MSKGIVWIALLACLAVFLAPVLPHAAEEEAPKKNYGQEVGMYMKPFALKSPIDKKMYNSEELLGKPTLISFIQSACRICQFEVRELNSLYTGLKDRFNVVVVMLDVDDARIPGYKKRYSIEFPIVHDPEAAVAASVGISSSPATVILDKEGKILQRESGYHQGMLQEMVDKVK
jgi:peroxiredoxin